jgi:hypothetical protein
MSHHHDGQIITSKPSQLTQFIQWMILDGLGRVFIASMSGSRLVQVMQTVENSAQPTQLVTQNPDAPQP